MINFFGPVSILELSKKCKHLQVFCHISTAYVNCNLDIEMVEEQIYYGHEESKDYLAYA